jgi:hypothetical protein
MDKQNIFLRNAVQLAHIGDVVELFVAIGMVGAVASLSVRLQTCNQDRAKSPRSRARKRGGLTCARLWLNDVNCETSKQWPQAIATRRRFHEALEIVHQRRVFDDLFLVATAELANAPLARMTFLADIFLATTDRAASDPRHARKASPAAMVFFMPTIYTHLIRS